MPTLQIQFKQAQEEANNLPERPDNDTLLELYALYKQGTIGDIQGDPPDAFDFVRRMKYEAWQKLRGTKQEDAMRKYIALVADLKGQ